MKRKLEKDISMSELYHLRESGMTNHQIAQSIGVSEATIYRYIGRRSQAVKYAEIQNKPCPIGNAAITTDAPNVSTVEDAPSNIEAAEPVGAVPAPVTPDFGTSMPIIKQSRVIDLQGVACVYHVDTSSTVIEMRDANSGTITGVLDAFDIPVFVRELEEVAQMVQAQNRGTP